MANNNGEYISRQLLLAKINDVARDAHGNSNFMRALERLRAIVRTMDGSDIKKVAYICDGTACDPKRASCKRGGPCHHTTQIEHAKHFFKLEGADGWFEVDKTSEVNDG